MKSIQKIKIAAASALAGLLLYGCSQQSDTPSPSATTTETTTQGGDISGDRAAHQSPVGRHHQFAGLRDGYRAAAGSHHADFHECLAAGHARAVLAIMALRCPC